MAPEATGGLLLMSQNTSEFDAFKAVHDALHPFDPQARARILKSVATLLEIGVPVKDTGGEAEGASDNHGDENGDTAPTYSAFAELHAAASPSSDAEHALVAGYWLQVSQGNESFTGQGANKELAHLGHKSSNIARALQTLIDAKPQLVLQLKKSGSSKQSRKTYKLSLAGVKRVEEMVGE